MNSYKIVRENITQSIINEDGNIIKKEKSMYLLKNEDNEIISNPYYYMFSLGNDHFGICNLAVNIEIFASYDNYDYYNAITKENYNITDSKLKWGVMRIRRDLEGNIIPKNEEIIIPYLYDKLTANVNDIIPTQYHNKSTYISLDINKNTYGKQLVPCILENATPFGTEFENFAECTINSKKGYLPKNCQVLNKIDENTLLTKEQVIYLTNILEKNNEVFDTNEEAITAYYNLTNEFILPNTSVNKIKRK